MTEGVRLGTRGTDVMRSEPRQIIVSAERLAECQESLEDTFHQIVDQAVSCGWSTEEILVALSGLISKELSDRPRVTLH